MVDDEDPEMNEDAPNEDILEGEEGEGGEEGEEGEGGEGLDKKKLILIAGGAVVLLMAIGAGLFFTGMLDGLLGKAEQECVEVDDGHGNMVEECTAKEEEHAADGGGDGHGGDDGHGGGSGQFLEIPTMLVNLSSNDGTPRYLRLTVQLELYSSADNPAVEAVIPRVVDQFQTYLRELRVKDLRGSAGIYRLQMELLWRVNQAAAPVKVKDVLFQEILIQ